ncbi:hypothetical protein D2T31_07300 [Sinirhodobacter populi]|uniref:Helix-turn-helix domain-containing protein n=1 Tax=Paenirhodobacter populi TaxID=2306993 RepID=A0A443KDC0_9RHOB|nr:hypothetical protein [Sinirhodobacter populi]RWR30770.1 hypothetical protein D2T31_07300 [Sinirhodobacter populi]
MMAKKRKQEADTRGRMERRRDGGDGAPFPSAHMDWWFSVQQTPRGTITEREKVFAATLATEAIDPKTGECDWTPEQLAPLSGSNPESIRVAIDRLTKAGWLSQRLRLADGAMILRLSWPTWNELHPDFGPLTRCAALSVSALIDQLHRTDHIPEESVLFGAVSASASAVAAKHGPQEAARLLRDLALLWEDPEAWANGEADQ